ncbi:MAG TPA: DUF3105 domain-containing protein [Homoserinimonas sp.]|nr:DUF3105 domain-containing protein [Homoserinimonas sp.]
MAPSDRPEPVLPPSAKKLTVKQEREARRQAKVEQFKKQQARAKRNRIVAIALSSVAAVAVLALIITVVISNATPKRDPADIEIAGIDTWPDIEFGHVNTAVDYEEMYGTNPPAGGVHNPAWLNCGIYTEPQQNENAVHSLEHGAVWVTYNPEELDEAEIEELRSQRPDTYIILSPYPGLDAPVVASAWGAQVKLDGVEDQRLADFVEKYWQSPNVPEAGALCTRGIDGPGQVS